MTSLTFADITVRQHTRLITRLAHDLELIRLELGPTAQDLENAPIIDNWYVGARMEPALVGDIADHPLVDGSGITSGLYVLDPERGYARTLSRFYKLGREIS